MKKEHKHAIITVVVVVVIAIVAYKIYENSQSKPVVAAVPPATPTPTSY